MTWTSDTIITNGFRQHYTRTGGDNPPLLLLHGLTDNGLYLSTIAQDLEGEYDVIMPDARGHGLSDPVAEDSTWTTAAEDTALLIQQLGLGQPGIIGHSMGAGTAGILAAIHPELVRYLVLEDPPLFDRLPSADPNSKERFAPSPWEQSLITLKTLSREQQLAAARSEHPAWPEVELERWVDTKVQFNLASFRLLFGKLPDWREVMPKIHCPVLLITGDNDKGSIVTPAIAEELAQKLPNCHVAHIPGAGHSIRFDQHDAYLKAVTAFLHEQAK